MESIEKGNWFLIIDLNGGRIGELRYKGELVLGTFNRIDGKQGNTHVCCPNFGSEGMEELGLPFHGPFRKNQWKSVSKRRSKLEIESVDLGLRVKQIFELGDSFCHKIVIQNLENKRKLVNVAVHNYWSAENGWKGTRLNGKLVDEFIKTDSSVTLSKINVLEIPSKLRYKWSLKGFKYVQFWTAFKEGSKRKRKYDQKYVCIEPALERQGFLDKKLINLSPLALLELRQEILALG